MLKMNPEDKVSCFRCGSHENEESSLMFESITLDDGVNQGSMTVFLCPKCRKSMLEDAIARMFRKRFLRRGQERWEIEVNQVTFPNMGQLVEKLSEHTGMPQGEIEEILDELRMKS